MSDPTTTRTVSTGPIPLMTMEELLQTTEALKSLEERDRNKIRSFLDVDQVALRARLLSWANLGFPDQYVLYTIQFSQHHTCSDGVSRDLLSYLPFLVPNFSIVDAVSQLEAKLPGMALSYSYTASNCLSVHVSKKAL